MIRISGTTRMAGMMTRIPRMTMLTGVTGMTVMKRICRKTLVTSMTTAMR